MASLEALRPTFSSFRSKVEAKKTELRELVGDHYRSVLESSDHIRAMSECGLEGIQSLDWSCSIEFCLSIRCFQERCAKIK